MKQIEKERLYKKVIDHWGEELQFGMLTEEVGELFQAINRYRRGRTTNTDNIAEEIADVRLMLEQMEFMFNITNSDEWYNKKLDKLKGQLKRGDK